MNGEACSYEAECATALNNNMETHLVLFVATKLYQISEHIAFIKHLKEGQVLYNQNGLETGFNCDYGLIWSISSNASSSFSVSINNYKCFYYNADKISGFISEILDRIGGVGLHISDFNVEKICKFAVACTSARIAASKRTIGNALKCKTVCDDCIAIIEEVLSVYSDLIKPLNMHRLDNARRQIICTFKRDQNYLLSRNLISSYTSLQLDLLRNRPTELPWLNDKVCRDSHLVGKDAVYNRLASQQLMNLMSKEQLEEYLKQRDLLYEQ